VSESQTTVVPELPKEAEPTVTIVDARQLFQGRREVVVVHEGARYRLRITRRNKLILQK
jgi:hemin uptake protein HemP